MFIAIYAIYKFILFGSYFIFFRGNNIIFYWIFILFFFILYTSLTHILGSCDLYFFFVSNIIMKREVEKRKTKKIEKSWNKYWNIQWNENTNRKMYGDYGSSLKSCKCYALRCVLPSIPNGWIKKKNHTNVNMKKEMTMKKK